MFCASCGSNIGPSTPFCPFCGAKLRQSAAAAGRLSLSSPEGIYAISPQEDLAGVWGWLLFFCVILTVIRPLLLAIDGFGGPWYLILLEWLGAVFGVVVGISLWSRAEYALKLLRFYFGVAFAFGLLGLIASAIAFVIQGLKTETSGFVGSMGGFLLALARLTILALWFIYFRTSQRVKSTYGANL
jgi:hypothetical protein